MTGYKSALSSTGIWGGIVALLAMLANTLGYSITGADQETIVNVVSQVVAIVGTLAGIYGRITATKKIGKAT